MVGASIAGTVGSLAMGAKSSRAAGKAGAQANAYATQNYNYQMEGMNNYIGGAQGMYGLVSGMSFGGGTAGGYAAEGGDTGGIEFAQGLLDDWEDTFGGIEENLKGYYENLDPVKFATQGKAQLMASMDKQMKQFNETMAATGLQSAGMKQQAAKEAAFQVAQGNAAIDINAPEQVAQMQQGFLNYGSGFKNQASGLLGQAYATDAQTKTQASIATAANKTQASISNSQVNAQAAAAKSAAMMGAAYYGNNAYLQQAQYNDPRIATAQGNQQMYQNDAAGWGKTAGNIAGGAISGGLWGDFGGGSSGFGNPAQAINRGTFNGPANGYGF